MSNETQSSTPWGYTATNNGDQIAAQVALATLTKRESYDPISMVNADGLSSVRNMLHDLGLAQGIKFCDLGMKIGEVGCDVLKSIGDSEARLQSKIGDATCDILTKVGDAECSIIKNDMDLHHRNTIHLAAIERDLQNRIFETQKEALNTKTAIFEKVDRETDFIRLEQNNFRFETTKNFGDQKLQLCEVENRLARQLEMCCCDLKEKIDSNEISRLKDKVQHLELVSAINAKCCNGNGNGNNGNGNG